MRFAVPGKDLSATLDDDMPRASSGCDRSPEARPVLFCRLTMILLLGLAGCPRQGMADETSSLIRIDSQQRSGTALPPPAESIRDGRSKADTQPEGSPRLRLPPASKGPVTLTDGASGRLPITTLLSGLAMGLGLVAGMLWLARRKPVRHGNLPSEVLQVLGECQLAARHPAVLVRCGQRVLLIGLSPAGPRTLTAIDDPQEVNRLCVACASGGSTSAFQDVLRQLERTPASRSFA
jgi:flagellar biogenesis protein FliO